MTEIKRDVQLQPRRMKPAEQVSMRYGVTLEPGHTREDLDNPAYWAHVAVQLSQGDILEVRTDTGSHYGRFIVTSCSRNHAKLSELEWVELDQAIEVMDDRYVYAWKGPVLKHCIIRKSDGAIVHEVMESKAAALQWIANERKAA